jgi:hypothetical protein
MVLGYDSKIAKMGVWSVGLLFFAGQSETLKSWIGVKEGMR